MVLALATIAAVSVTGEQSRTGCRRPGRASCPATAQQAMVIQTPCRHSAKVQWAPSHVWQWWAKVFSSVHDPPMHGCALHLSNIQATIEKVQVV